MISARHLGKKTALSAIALALGLGSAAVAAPLTGVHPLAAKAARPAATGTFSLLHSFDVTDGSAPVGNLDLGFNITAAGALTRTIYGTTEGGGAYSAGSIFSYTLATNAFKSVYSFTGGTDGSIPAEGLMTNDSNYFSLGETQLGTTITGGTYGAGTVYSLSGSGTVKVLHEFTGGTDGASPAGRLTLFLDGNYYGTTSSGGTSGYGTIYKISSTGKFSTVYSFTGGTDGGSPQAGLALGERFGFGPLTKLTPAMMHTAATSKAFLIPYLYGTTSTGGTYGVGTLFRIDVSGQLQTIYTFTGGADGGVPAAKLVSDNIGSLYGTTTVGGSAGNGVIFRLYLNHTKPTVIYDFGNGATGANPQAQLTVGLSTGNLYGTTTAGGASGECGSIFEITPGGKFTDIHDFASTDGANPQGALVDGGDGLLYGTAVSGGAFGNGALFSITE